ncbi:MAG: hypothetical protein MZV70_08690 [Desulfobacterales bacterium]|nr:hypothetical protein [Desulfobacterales bacterium]
MRKRRSRRVKPLLLDQGFVAGLGNIYADEALWEAKIHPRRLSRLTVATEAGALHAAIRRVLRRGLKNLGTSLGTGKANFYSVGAPARPQPGRAQGVPPHGRALPALRRACPTHHRRAAQHAHMSEMPER